jgi:hypothetical protein
VAEGLRSGFASLLAGRTGTSRPKCVAILLVLGSSLLLQTVSAVGQSPASPQAKKGSQASPNPPAAEPPPPPPAQIWLPPLQNPEHAPLISWDGKLLTIDAENSSLGEIMLGIRSRTGASIDMPASTNRERIAVHLGPAPIREVLSSLLYGTDFNYVVQSSEDDDSALGKVILIPRDGDQSADQSEDTVANDTDSPHSNPKIRLMPGYSAPGKRDYEVAHSKTKGESSSTVAEAPVADSSEQSTDAPAVAVDSAAPNAQTDAPVASNTEATDSSSSPDPSTLTASDQPLSTGVSGIVTANGSTAASTESGTPLSQMEQNMQKLYQQRQQLQAQQNRPAQTPARN